MIPLLSVVIPTRNRPVELLHAVRSALRLGNLTAIEVIVASNGESLDYDISQLDNTIISQIKIVRSPERLSLSQNWKFALGYASGTWVHVLGDDDIIILESDFNLDSLLKTNNVNGIKFEISHFDWVGGHPQHENKSNSKHDGSIVTTRIVKNWGRSWWKVLPHRYPTSTAHSLVRRDWLQSHGLENTYNSRSPDWYTGAVFAFTQDSFLHVNKLWASIGNHPDSSIALMKNPKRSLSVTENRLSSSDGNLILQTIYNGVFPTTWLSRTDALIQARMVCFADYSFPIAKLVRESYKTTPRYVIKVYLLQRIKAPSLSWRHELWLAYYLSVATFKAVKLRLRVF
jgi:glycosyltransferase involved in cell wall biosynthesis